MGDRTHCTLTLCGLVSTQAMNEIVQAVQDNYCSSANVRECILKQDVNLEFEEVNYGEMDADLANILQAANVGYIWEWGSGGDYGPGMEIYDPRTKDVLSANTNGQEIVITLSAAKDPEKLEEATKASEAESFILKTPTKEYSSAHERMELLGKHPAFKEFGKAKAEGEDGAETQDAA